MKFIRNLGLFLILFSAAVMAEPPASEENKGYVDCIGALKTVFVTTQNQRFFPGLMDHGMALITGKRRGHLEVIYVFSGKNIYECSYEPGTSRMSWTIPISAGEKKFMVERNSEGKLTKSDKSYATKTPSYEGGSVQSEKCVDISGKSETARKETAGALKEWIPKVHKEYAGNLKNGGEETKSRYVKGLYNCSNISEIEEVVREERSKFPTQGPTPEPKPEVTR